MAKLESLRKGADFALAFREGNRRRGRAFSLFFRKGRQGGPRVGVVAPRRLGGAVRRNRIRRQVKAIIRHGIEMLEDGTDYVVVVNEPGNFQKMENELGTMLRAIREGRG